MTEHVISPEKVLFSKSNQSFLVKKKKKSNKNTSDK